MVSWKTLDINKPKPTAFGKAMPSTGIEARIGQCNCSLKFCFQPYQLVWEANPDMFYSVRLAAGQ